MTDPAIYADWQPIETAPKDGTEILATHNRGGKFIKPYITSFSRAKQRSDGYIANNGKPWWLAYNKTHLAPTPTHWVPLLEPLCNAPLPSPKKGKK